MAKLKVKTSSPVLSNIFKGSLISVSITLVSILVFALIIKFANVPDNVIAPVNQAIKIVSIFFGCFLSLKHYQQKGLATGAMIGLIYTLLAFLIFSLLGNTFNLNLSLFVDALFSIIVGAICGIFSVNKKIRA